MNNEIQNANDVESSNMYDHNFASALMDQLHNCWIDTKQLLRALDVRDEKIMRFELAMRMIARQCSEVEDSPRLYDARDLASAIFARAKEALSPSSPPKP